MLNTIFARLSALLRESREWATDNAWYGAAEQAIGAIFALHPHPETLITELLRVMISAVFEAPAGSGAGALNPTASSSELAKLFFVCGHTAVKMLVHLEQIEARIKVARGGGKPGTKRTDGAAAAPAAGEKKAAKPAKAKAPAKGKKKKAADSDDDEPEDESEHDQSGGQSGGGGGGGG
jgi:hypothetical protein